jgi:hypothetical protein
MQQPIPTSSPRSARASPFTTTPASTFLLPGAAQPPWFAAAYAAPPPGSPRVEPTPLLGTGAPAVYTPGEDRVPPAIAAAVAGLQQRVSDVIHGVTADIATQQDDFDDVKYELQSIKRALAAIASVVGATGGGCCCARGHWSTLLAACI